MPRVFEQDAGVTVMVVTVASPKKALEFVEAQNELPLSTVFCSANLEAYKARYPLKCLIFWHKLNLSNISTFT